MTSTRADTEVEAKRLDALWQHGILETPPEDLFDSVADVAARLCDTPIALISFVDADREWVKAAHGTDLPNVKREQSLGDRVVSAGGRPVVIGDAATDPDLEGHPWLSRGPQARFYAAVPLRSAGGLAIGTLAVVDVCPRDEAAGALLLDPLAAAARMLEGALETRRESVLAGALTCVVDFEGRFLRVSAGWEGLLGVPAKSLAGRSFLDFVHPDDREQTVAETERELTGAGTRAFENRYVRPDGEVRWLLWQSHPVTEERVIYAVAKDVTDLKRGELALRESEERYRLLAESATDVVARYGLDLRVEYVSQSSERTMGYPPEDLIGRDAYELIHPDDRETVARFHAALTQGTERVRVVFRVIHRDGHALWVESAAHVIRDAGGRVVGIQAANRDITDAKRSLEALQQAEERFRRAFEDAPIGLAIVALNGDFQRVNRALCDLLGYSEGDLLELSAPAVAEAGAEEAREIARSLLKGKRRSATLERQLRRRDGGRVRVSMGMSVMRDADGRPTAFLVQYLDVSERHRAEAEARRAREAAERANRAKSAFLARMSHELRTPLNAVLGFAQLLQLEDLTEEQQDSVARIVRGGAHLVDVINDVLDISRIEAGEMAVEPEPVALLELIDGVVGMLRPLASEREMTLEVEAMDPEQHVHADRQRLKQVLLNLVSNAIKYGPEGSRVAVSVSAADERVRIAVLDEGPGLSAEEAERVFVPFERLPAHAAIEGTGLGLALSRNLTRAMGGDVTVVANGAGSEFRLDLRAAAPESPAAPPEQRGAAPAADPGDGEPRTVLYIEDSSVNVELMQRLLAERPNLELLVARDLASGRELAAERPDAILLDVNLPDGDGGDLIRELKADPQTAAIPVIVVTAEATREQEERLRAAGAEAYEVKPIDVQAFLGTLDAALAAD